MSERIRIIPSPDRGVVLHREECPTTREGFLDVRLTHSLISPGTERMQINNWVGKTQEEIVASRVSLGYCAAGIVEESRVDGIAAGDRVACYGGAYVAHATRNIVPAVLAVKMPDDLKPMPACFMGLGAISMHGFRLAQCGLGDRVLVIGAGVIGNLCAQLAMIAGCHVMVSELHPRRLEMMQDLLDSAGRHAAIAPPSDINVLRDFAGGHGFDAVCLCIPNVNREVFHMASLVVRNGGRVVLMGGGEIDTPRPPFFDTEATICVSRAAGPGRYDPSYEADGVDYPIQYVRWTEGRNIREVLHLIACGLLKVDGLINSVYTVGQVHAAYEAIHNDRDVIGVFLDWTKAEGI